MTKKPTLCYHVERPILENDELPLLFEMQHKPTVSFIDFIWYFTKNVSSKLFVDPKITSEVLAPYHKMKLSPILFNGEGSQLFQTYNICLEQVPCIRTFKVFNLEDYDAEIEQNVCNCNIEILEGDNYRKSVFNNIFKNYRNKEHVGFMWQ